MLSTTRTAAQLAIPPQFASTSSSSGRQSRLIRRRTFNTASGHAKLLCPANQAASCNLRRPQVLRLSKRAEAVVVLAAAAEDTDKSLQELNQDEFYPFLENAGDKLVVVDFYTDWCGPCKVMLPLLEDMAQELKGKADIVKFNCNAKNKELGKKLNVRVAPTFHIYKNSNKVAEMTGAKIEELRSLVEESL